MILKVLGLLLKIILILLLILLILLVYILFSPFKYRVAFSIEEKKFDLSLHSFLSFLKFRLWYENGIEMRLSLLWGRKILLGEEKEASITEEPEEDEEEEYFPDALDELVDDSELDTTRDSSSNTGSKKAKSSNSNTFKAKDKEKGILDQIKDKRNQEAVKFILSKVIYFLKRIAPSVEELDLSYCLGDPDTTGYLTGVLSTLPFVYHKNAIVCPDFKGEDPYLSGHGSLKGYIRLYLIAYLVILVLLNKDCRRLFHQLGGK